MMTSTSDFITQVVEEGRGPERGPYSFSRLGSCPLKFKRDYIERDTGTELTRFGQSIGSAMHDLAELDILMRNEHEPDQWLEPIDLVQRFVEENTEYQHMFHVLVDQMETFRLQFETNKQNYVASEQHVGVDLGMNWVDYDDPKCWFRGRIDYLEVGESGLARVVDFKNYPGLHSNQSLNDTFNGVGCQLMGYLAMIMAMDKRINGAFYEVYYFRYGVSKTPYINTEDGRSERRIITREEVERWWRFNQRKMLVFERRGSFPAQPSQEACQYCRHVESCDWHQAKNPVEIIAVDDDSAKDLARRVIVLQEEEKRLKATLGHYTNRFGILELEGGVQCGPVPRQYTNIDVQKFLDVCKDSEVDPTPYLTINKTNADKLMRRLNGEQQAKLQEAFTVTLGTVTKYG